MTSIRLKLQQLLVPTMRLSGHQWHSRGGCLAGIVHRTWTRRSVGDRVVPSKGRGIASHDGMVYHRHDLILLFQVDEKPRFTKKGNPHYSGR